MYKPSSLASILGGAICSLAFLGLSKAAVFVGIVGAIVLLGIIGDLLTDLVTDLVYNKPKEGPDRNAKP